MWQLFTEQARRVILLAQEEAILMRSGHVATEHLLLGLVREDQGVAAEVLHKVGITLPKVRTEIEAAANQTSGTSDEPKLTPQAQRVLELAADDARRLHHNYIGTEHILLALLRGEILSAVILRRLGLSAETARALVMEYLGDAEASQDVLPTPIQKSMPEIPPLPPKAQAEMSLSQFVGNLNAGLAFPDNFKFVFGARPGYYGANEWADHWNRGHQQIQIERLEIILIEGDVAQANVTYSVGTTSPSPTPLVESANRKGWTEIVTLKLISDGEEQLWQIVPPDGLPISDKWLEPALINEAAFALAQNHDDQQPQNLSRYSLIQLKQLALAALQFSADWGGQFAFAPQYVREALEPYLRNPQSFIVLGNRGVYKFNESLCGQTLDQVAEPSQTVMFHEGESQTLYFRYDDKAAVAFVDGHCALVSKAEADQLLWGA